MSMFSVARQSKGMGQDTEVMALADGANQLLVRHRHVTPLQTDRVHLDYPHR